MPECDSTYSQTHANGPFIKAHIVFGFTLPFVAALRAGHFLSYHGDEESGAKQQLNPCDQDVSKKP